MEFKINYIAVARSVVKIPRCEKENCAALLLLLLLVYRFLYHFQLQHWSRRWRRYCFFSGVANKTKTPILQIIIEQMQALMPVFATPPIEKCSNVLGDESAEKRDVVVW